MTRSANYQIQLQLLADIRNNRDVPAAAAAWSDLLSESTPEELGYPNREEMDADALLVALVGGHPPRHSVETPAVTVNLDETAVPPVSPVKQLVVEMLKRALDGAFRKGTATFRNGWLELKLGKANTTDLRDDMTAAEFDILREWTLMVTGLRLGPLADNPVAHAVRVLDISQCNGYGSHGNPLPEMAVANLERLGRLPNLTELRVRGYRHSPDLAPQLRGFCLSDSTVIGLRGLPPSVNLVDLTHNPISDDALVRFAAEAESLRDATQIIRPDGSSVTVGDLRARSPADRAPDASPPTHAEREQGRRNNRSWFQFLGF